jgi:head-tail adaptor
MAIGFGDLDRQVELIRNDTVNDGQGGGLDRSHTLIIWARVRKISGVRSMQSGQAANTKGYQIDVCKPVDFEIKEGNQIKDSGILITLSLIQEHPENKRFLRMEGKSR